MAILKVKDKDGNVIEIPAIAGPPGKDGEPGKDGAAGKDGKSAYEYAKDGGYPGTEEEFAAKLAKEDSTSNKANEIVETVTGTNIIVTDAANESLRGLKLFGKSEQKSTTGKNLCKITLTDQTISGVTFTVNADRSITLNGTCTADIYLNMGLALLEGGVEYTISGCPKFANWNDGGLYVNATPASGNTWNRENESVFTMPNTHEYTCTIQLRKDVVLTNVIFYPMIRLSSNTDSTYEPYGLSPSPQYPEEITSVGDDGTLDAILNSGNLFDVNSVESGSNKSFTVEEDGYKITVVGGTAAYTSSAITLPDYIAGKTLYIKYDKATRTNVGTNATVVQLKYVTNGKTIYNDASDTDMVTRIVNVPDDATSIKFVIYTNNSSSPLETDATLTIYGLRIGLSDIPYEPYKKQSLTIPTPDGLHGIKVTNPSFANYTDQDGQLWVTDEIDLERGKYIHRIYKERLVATVRSDTSSYAPRYLMNVSKTYNILPCEILSTRFKYKVWGSGNGCIGSSNTDAINTLWFGMPEDITTVEECNAFLEANPTYVYYALETPIETNLTEEQIAQYKALTTNYPNTTFISDAFTSVDYVADTKKYIDKKFVELASALV